MSYIVLRSGVRLTAVANYAGCRITLDKRRPEDGGWSRVVNHFVLPADRKAGIELVKFFGGSDERVLRLSVNGGTLELSYDESGLPVPYELSLPDITSVRLRSVEVGTVCHMVAEYFDVGDPEFNRYGAGRNRDDQKLPSVIIDVGESLSDEICLTIGSSVRAIIDLMGEDNSHLRVYGETGRNVDMVMVWLSANGYTRAKIIS